MILRMRWIKFNLRMNLGAKKIESMIYSAFQSGI